MINRSLSNTFFVLAALGLFTGACAPSEHASIGVWPQDLDRDAPARADGFAANPDFRPDSPRIAQRSSALSVADEVVVIEGDARTVTTAGRAYGITEANANAIIETVLTAVPDELDTIQIFLTFRDAANQGAAYYRGLRNDIAGIGQEVFDTRGDLGLSPKGRLSGFSNMNDMALFGSFEQLVIPRGPYFAVMAQELSHRWLMTLRFKDDAGTVSDALKGRQDAHWSALVHAYGSVQDGINWLDNQDGTFTHDGESNRGFAPFDRYAMGLLPPAQVEPTFLIEGAELGGRPLSSTSHAALARGAKVRGRRVPVTIEQVIAALGPRNPPAGTETPYHRVGFVLVTHPGQPREAWEPYLEALKNVQRTFPETWRSWTGGAGAICTRISGRCPEPVIGLESYRVVGGEGGSVAPGQRFELQVALRNDGLGTAEGVQVSVEAMGESVSVVTPPMAAPPVPEGGEVALPAGFTLEAAPTLECGDFVRLVVRAKTREGPVFSKTIDVVVGTRTVMVDPLEDSADWHVNPDGTDTAKEGLWDLGEVEPIAVAGVVTQPAEDHSPGTAKFSFQTGSKKGRFFADHDVDGGKTTLESPVFPLRGLRDPTLVFYAWHVATDLSKPKREPVVGADLVVRGTDDGGHTWKELGRVNHDTSSWERVALRLRDRLELTNRVRFRFEIEDDSLAGTVEAGVDDLSIVELLEGCRVEGESPPVSDTSGAVGAADDAGGCAATHGRAGLEGLLFLVGLLGALRATHVRRG